MDQNDELAEAFVAERGRLIAIAARVLGTRADAEDVVQEAWVRLMRQEPGTIANVAAWLTTVVGRLSIDVLRARTAKAEVFSELDLADLVVTEDDDAAGNPESAALQADSLGLALLVVLGKLEPDERMAFVLHDMFSVPFGEIGAVLGKSADAAKMSASRARRKVRSQRPAQTTSSSLREQRAVVDAFLAASLQGNFEALLDILHPDLTWEIHGPKRVVTRTGSHHLLDALARGSNGKVTARRVLVNGRPGILAWGPDGQPFSLMSCTVEDGRMTKIASIVDRRWLTAQNLPTAN